ncbi:nucleotide pyrophosphohydrolase [Microbulbifer variabilis]|uniref:nucleotide pyrophosphohydrolase n=1 Tax=Microbulbifer variabilis TaxID=266805 RepID=UPI001CFE706B|nr:nucleotide pyrophosphohydrolase [Microbulbifer variabilis]
MKNSEILVAFDKVAKLQGWQQLHTAKNLAMALSVEVAELNRHFQWREDGEIHSLMQSEHAEEVAAELADVQMYLCKLAEVQGVDMEVALRNKIAENERRATEVEDGGAP